MNIVFVSPHFPTNFYLFPQALLARGATVVGLGDVPWEALTPETRGALTEYYRVDDLHQYDALLRACGHITWRFGRIDRLESHNEHWLESDARLRTDFNIPGIRTDRIAAMRHKSLMKEVFAAHGVPHIRGRRVVRVEEALELGQEVGYPLCLKPDSGVGASGVWKVHEPWQVVDAFSRSPGVTFMAEEFVEGRIFTFDGLADAQGRVVWATSLAYGEGVIESVNHNNHVFYHTLREVPADLQELGQRVVKAYDVRERFFHLEFFRRFRDRSLVAIEVNMRPAGGLSLDMYNYACDGDLYKLWAEVVTEGSTNTHLDQRYFCAFLGRKYHKDYLHSHETLVSLLGERLVLHGQLSALFRRAMGDYYYVVRAPEEGQILEAARAILGVQNAPLEPMLQSPLTQL